MNKIYAITVSPFQEIYIGFTVQPLRDRIRQHIDRQGAVSQWLRGRDPVVIVLQSGCGRQAEKLWISHFRESTYRVMNQTSGGEGGDGYRIKWRVDLLGKYPDEVVAEMHGATRKAVAYQRKKRGIPPCGNREEMRYVHDVAGWNKKQLPDDIPFGSMSDDQLAKLYGVSKYTIARRRRELGVTSYAKATGNDGRFFVGMPHPRWSRGEDS